MGDACRPALAINVAKFSAAGASWARLPSQSWKGCMEYVWFYENNSLAHQT